MKIIYLMGFFSAFLAGFSANARSNDSLPEDFLKCDDSLKLSPELNQATGQSDYLFDEDGKKQLESWLSNDKFKFYIYDKAEKKVCLVDTHREMQKEEHIGGTLSDQFTRRTYKRSFKCGSHTIYAEISTWSEWTDWGLFPTWHNEKINYIGLATSTDDATSYFPVNAEQDYKSGDIWADYSRKMLENQVAADMEAFSKKCGGAINYLRTSASSTSSYSLIKKVKPYCESVLQNSCANLQGKYVDMGKAVNKAQGIVTDLRDSPAGASRTKGTTSSEKAE